MVYIGNTPKQLKLSHGESYVLIDIDRKFEQKDFVEAQKKYSGYKESNKVNDWLSDKLGFECVLLRAHPSRDMPLDEKHVQLV